MHAMAGRNAFERAACMVAGLGVGAMEMTFLCEAAVRGMPGRTDTILVETPLFALFSLAAVAVAAAVAVGLFRTGGARIFGEIFRPSVWAAGVAFALLFVAIGFGLGGFANLFDWQSPSAFPHPWRGVIYTVGMALSGLATGMFMLLLWRGRG